MRWDKERGNMRWDREWEREDNESGEKADSRTFRELRQLGNSIDPDINMKEDIPSKNEDGKLPVLDTKVWVEREEGGARRA